MAASIPCTQVTEGSIIAPFADTTMDDYLALVERNPDSHFEFNAAGDVIVMAPVAEHGNTQSMVGARLIPWLWTGALPGYHAGSEITFDLGDWRCQPDVCVHQARGKIFPREAPLLAVEICSDSNTWRELRAKAARYLEHGTRMVWLIDTDERTLELHRADAPPQTLRGDDLIDGGEVLPGLSLPVSDLFPFPED
ncbi:MAG: Uma2 family endonuclease [Anaerolineaceae bacterium]|nr:Uma2 family endonuclease [Anaerolineaceae bacterium]MDE0327922.1 Uma2 family endonuclease [Anaerolineaceae bacterium]